jgi:ribonuclease J
MFASNIQRLRMLGEIARRVDRKICVLGRSLNTQIEVAHEIGRLDWPSNLMLAPEQARSWPRDELLVLAGGSQAERNSALARLGADSHNHLAVEAGDTIILSARIIPGNERVVHALISTLLRKGAVVHTRLTEPDVHTSGHAVRQEQQRMLELLRPRAFVPVHGSLHHLLRHAELARSLGIDPVLTVENGTPFRLEDGQLLREGPVRHGRVPIAYGGEPIDPETLGRRAELGRTGVVAIAVTVDAQGRILADPTVSAYGVPAVDGDGAALRQVTREVVHACSRSRRRSDETMLTEEIRRAARRRLFDLCGCRPVVQVQVAVTGAAEES